MLVQTGTGTLDSSLPADGSRIRTSYPFYTRRYNPVCIRRRDLDEEEHVLMSAVNVYAGDAGIGNVISAAVSQVEAVGLVM